MRKFRVKVDGEVFEVEVVEVGAQAVSTPVAPTSKKIPAVSYDIPQKKVDQPIQAPVAGREPTVSAKPVVADGAVTAPIPGIVTEIKVATGEKVKRGQVLLLLEAMKMQNEILAPYDAIVAEILVSQGASVQTGDILVKLDK